MIILIISAIMHVWLIFLQVNKAQTLPTSMQPIYMSHDHVIQSPARTNDVRSRSLTPDPSRSASYAQNPIYGRMGISPERPPPPQVSLFDLILTSQSTIFQLGWTSTKLGLMCLAQGQNAVTLVRLEPAALLSWVKDYHWAIAIPPQVRVVSQHNSVFYHIWCTVKPA